MASSIFKPANLDMPSSTGSNLSESLDILNKLSKNKDVIVDAEHPYNPGKGFRLKFDKEFGENFGTGYSDLVQLREDLLVRITMATANHALSATHLGENWLKLEFWIAGEVSLVFKDRGQIDFEGRWCFIHWHPEGVDKGEWVGQGEGIAVTIYCRPSYLEQTLGNQVGQLPTALRKLALNHTAESMFEILPLTQSMARAVMDMVNISSIGSLRHMYIEAKTLELFSAAIEVLFRRDEELEDSVIKRLTRSEVNRLHDVRDHILNNLSQPPRIMSLCRQAGMNQQKLQQGFKALFGMTISDYCVTRRMEKARELLELNDLTVTQVAQSVGYEFANNFSTAFKRYFGILPKTYQMRFRANSNIAS